MRCATIARIQGPKGLKLARQLRDRPRQTFILSYVIMLISYLNFFVTLLNKSYKIILV